MYARFCRSSTLIARVVVKMTPHLPKAQDVGQWYVDVAWSGVHATCSSQVPCPEFDDVLQLLSLHTYIVCNGTLLQILTQGQNT